MAEDDEAVGYKRPPRHTRFPKGRSGNPGGRPRQLSSLRRELEAELAEEIVVSDGDRTASVTQMRAIAKAIVSAALQGDMRAVASIIALTRALAEPASTEDQAGDQELLEAYIEQEVNRRKKD
jgi:hypothetical protein